MTYRQNHPCPFCSPSMPAMQKLLVPNTGRRGQIARPRENCVEGMVANISPVQQENLWLQPGDAVKQQNNVAIELLFHITFH